MSIDQNSGLSVEEVAKALEEIENKYSTIKTSKHRDTFEEALSVLSKEFDSFGLPMIDLSQSITKIFKQVVGSARSLVHIHRKTISEIKDVTIDKQCNIAKSNDLNKMIDDCKMRMKKYHEKQSSLKNQILKLSDEQDDAKKREIILKSELDKTKRFYIRKENELLHSIRKLTKENQRLREICGKDLNIHNSKDEVTAKLLNKFKTDEEIYKNAIQKLQDNNKMLLEELLLLREEKALQFYKEVDCT